MVMSKRGKFGVASFVTLLAFALVTLATLRQSINIKLQKLHVEVAEDGDHMVIDMHLRRPDWSLHSAGVDGGLCQIMSTCDGAPCAVMEAEVVEVRDSSDGETATLHVQLRDLPPRARASTSFWPKCEAHTWVSLYGTGLLLRYPLEYGWEPVDAQRQWRINKAAEPDVKLPSKPGENATFQGEYVLEIILPHGTPSADWAHALLSDVEVSLNAGITYVEGHEGAFEVSSQVNGTITHTGGADSDVVVSVPLRVASRVDLVATVGVLTHALAGVAASEQGLPGAVDRTMYVQAKTSPVATLLGQRHSTTWRSGPGSNISRMTRKLARLQLEESGRRLLNPSQGWSFEIDETIYLDGDKNFFHVGASLVVKLDADDAVTELDCDIDWSLTEYGKESNGGRTTSCQMRSDVFQMVFSPFKDVHLGATVNSLEKEVTATINFEVPDIKFQATAKITNNDQPVKFEAMDGVVNIMMSEKEEPFKTLMSMEVSNRDGKWQMADTMSSENVYPSVRLGMKDSDEEKSANIRFATSQNFELSMEMLARNDGRLVKLFEDMDYEGFLKVTEQGPPRKLMTLEGNITQDGLRLVEWFDNGPSINVTLVSVTTENSLAVNFSIPDFALNTDIKLTNNGQPVEIFDMDGAVSISMFTAECDDPEDSDSDSHGSDNDHSSDSGGDRRLTMDSQCCSDCEDNDQDCRDNCHDCHSSDGGACCEDCCYDEEDRCRDCQRSCHDCHSSDYYYECQQTVMREHILFVTSVMSVRNDQLQMVGAIAPKLLDGTIEADVKNFALEKTAFANFSMLNGIAITADMSLKNNNQPVEDKDGRLDGECFATVMMFMPENDEGNHHHDNCCEECCQNDEGDHDVCLESYCHGECNDHCEYHRRLDVHEEGENSIALFRSTACSVHNDVFQMVGAIEGGATINFDIKNLDTRKGGTVLFDLRDFTLNTDIQLTNDGKPVELHDMDCICNITQSERGEPSRTVMTAEGSLHNDRFQLVTSLSDVVDALTVDVINRGNEFSFDVDLVINTTGCDDPAYEDEHHSACCEDCCRDEEDHCRDCQHSCHDCHGSDNDHSSDGGDRRLSMDSQCCSDCEDNDQDCRDNCHDCHSSDGGKCCEDCCYDDEDRCHDCQRSCHDCYGSDGGYYFHDECNQMVTHQTRIHTNFSIDNNNDDLPFSEENFRVNMGVTILQAGEPLFDIGWAALAGDLPVEEEKDEEDEEEEPPIVVKFAAKLEVSNPEAFVEDPGAKAGVIKGMADMLGIDKSYVDAVLSLVDARRLWEAARRLSVKAVQVDYVITVPAEEAKEAVDTVAMADTVASVNAAAMTSAIEAGLAEASANYTVAVKSVTEPVITQATENPAASDGAEGSSSTASSSTAVNADMASGAATARFGAAALGACAWWLQ